MTLNQSSNPAPHLDGTLGEKARIAIYNAGSVQVLPRGQALLKRPAGAVELCLVLNGSFRVVSANGGRQGMVFGPGDLIFAQALFDPDPSISAVAACEDSRALVLSTMAFRALDPEVRETILKNVSAALGAKCLSLSKSLTSAGFQKASLTRRLVGESRKRKKKYEQSELILGLIKKIPRLPIHVTQLIELLLSDNASAKRVTDLAKQDPSLVGEVLKEVNSVHYGIRQKISDLHYAIMLIGFNEVYQILVSKGLRRTMPDSEKFRDIHQHSIVMSYLALEISQFCDRPSASLLSTIGLLHDIGKSTVYLIEKENPKLSFFIQLLDPSKIGAMLLERWNLPGVICETVEYQDFPGFAPPSDIPSDFRKNIAILHLAHAVYDSIRDRAATAADYPFIDEYKALCGLGDKGLDAITDAVMKNLRIKANLLPMDVKRFVLTG